MSSKLATNVTAKKKWYEDDDLTVTEKEKDESQFSQGNIGVGFDAIKVKIQETYEIGILKLFIETEILKSGSGSFESGFKELYSPYSMTKPVRIGKELLFTSDVEFSEAGFLPGSLQDDRRKYFLNRLEFNNYLLRLPKPISDVETPVKEKTDSNAYKYLQILGSEEQNRILILCEKFGDNYVNKELGNSNAIIKLKKELSDIKLLAVDANLTQDAKMKLEEAKQKELIKEENKKIRLETKKKNYKAACKILSNAIRRAQYNITLEESRAATIKDANSLSTTIVDWMKYKQNSPDFFREILNIFKPVMSKQMQTNKETVGGKMQEVITKLTSMFKIIIESYFYNNLNNFVVGGGVPATIKPTDRTFLTNVIVLATRTNDPVKYSWNNIDSTLERVSKLTFVNAADKDAVDKLCSISRFMLNFQSELLRMFTFDKKDGGIQEIFEEITTSESASNSSGVVNMLYNNIVYLRAMLNKIIEAIQRAVVIGGPGLNGVLAILVPRLLPAQQHPAFLQQLTALRQLVDSLEPLVRAFHLAVKRNSYKTILGEASHAAFVESIFSQKVAPISHANRNNKFLVVSDFITDAYEIGPVTITIPDDYYDLATLGNAIEKELCDKCRWRVDAANNVAVRNTVWTCMYDENKKMQLKLYFPENELMNINNIIPNIHDAYPVGFIHPAPPPPPRSSPANNIFQVSGGYIVGAKTLTIPQGEYRDIQHLLEVMAKTINDFIGKVSIHVNRAYKTKMVITLDAARNRVKFEFKPKEFISNNPHVLGRYEQFDIDFNPLVDPAIPGVYHEGLSIILGCSPAAPAFVNLPPINFSTVEDRAVVPILYNEYEMPNPPNFPAASKSVTIETRMQIDGDEYDASGMFGVPSSVAPTGKIIITPEITIRELELSNRNKIKVNEMLDDYLGFSRIPNPPGPITSLKIISDYGVLNFTGGKGFRVTVYNPAAPVATAAITVLDAVDLSKIVSKANGGGANGAKLKTEIMENTGLYINNSLLQAKVPVITSTDILNSLFYRYPCIPSPEIKDISEGTLAFDKFIEERVNVSKFKDVVWLGKGKNDKSETLLLTIRKALDKTLMYDDCDEERSKLMCDLHYAICGPVFTDTVSKQQNREINELEMFHQFQIEIKRPDILSPATIALGGPQPRPIVKPFTVKGITPYYDSANKRYKYLIYGHYLNVSNSLLTGCVKYYDPGTKIGPQPKALQLYDILLFTLVAGGPTTVNSVVEVNYNKDDESFIYPVFQIAGVFDTIEQLDDFGGILIRKNQNNNVVWSPGKMDAGLPFVNNGHNVYSAAALAIIAGAPVVPYNSFNIIWNVTRLRGVALPPNSSNQIDLLTQRAPLVFDINSVIGGGGVVVGTVMSILNMYIKTCPKCIINKMIANDDTYIYLPYIDALGRSQNNEILIPGGAPRLQISCGAVSINKDIFNITQQIHFYQREYLVEVSSMPGVAPTPRLADIQNKIDALVLRLNNLGPPPFGLKRDNLRIESNMLWIGLKRRCVTAAGVVQREILSCTMIDHLNVVPGAQPDLVEVDLRNVTFLPGDFIEKIKVDINDPEIVTVFGRFTATVQDRFDATRVKTIQNAMVIYTNLGNQYNNNRNFGIIAAPPPPPPLLPYSLEYDNFQPITINGLPEFQGYYSCVDGLIVASNHGGGTVQQNMGTLLVKKNQTENPVAIGFHDHKITELTIDEQYSDASDIWSSILCYDYNMCADIMGYEWDAMTNQGKEIIDKGLFNPLSFKAFKTTLKNVDVIVSPAAPYVYRTNQQRITELFNGEFVLVASKQSRVVSNAFSKIHVLNTWGIDLSNEYTPFYKRIFEYEEGSQKFNLKIYEKYINKVVETIIGSAKKYYKDKIKISLLEEEEYGAITNPNSPPPNIRFRRQGNMNVVVTGGGRREDAAAMIVAKNVELEEMKKLQRYNNNKETQQETSTIEIRVPDIMMSDAYLAKLTSDEKNKVRNLFFDALYKYSKKLKEIAKEENANDLRTLGGQGNMVIKDLYKVVLCSLKLTEFKFDEMFKDKQAGDDVDDIESFLSVNTELYDYDLNDVKDGIKNVILVNEWNDRGFIGDYGAFAAASLTTSSSLTPNQMIISKTVKANPGAVAAAANQVVEYVPKVPNSSFLMNPFITYGTFDSSRWSGFNSMIHDNKGENEKAKEAVVVQVGGTREDDLRNLQMQLLRRQQQQTQYSPYFQGQSQGQGRFYNGYDDSYGQGQGRYDPFRQRYMEDDDDFGQILKLQRKAFEKTNISSTQLKEVSIQTMRTDNKLNRVVLWLCDFREGKMLMVKTHIGPNVILSLPSQQQFTGGNKISGYALLQQLCKRFFKTDAVIRKWTPEYAYIYSSTATGVFIYSAKSNELPKETMETAFVPMKAVFNMATEVKGQQALQISISNGDKLIVEEIFKVVALIQGGLISSTSKEFNDIVARLVSRTVPPHLRSVISESKRKNNTEANLNFLIKLFFSPNNLFILRGQIPYYIYSTQRNCKIYTIVKQEGYDDDSYLTCLKLFLQTEADFKSKDEGKASIFRVGCAVKKKLITDNFSAVWDTFWGDLIESEEQSKLDDQLETDVEGKAAEEGKAADKEGQGEGEGDDKDSSTVCLELAKQSGVRMYNLPVDWNVSKYWPMKYNDVYYNIRANEKYGFNNEFFYDLDSTQLTAHRRAAGGGLPDSYLGFKCIAYYKNGNNPILFLGDAGSLAIPVQPGRVYKLDLNTHKLTKFIETDANTNVLCMDILDVKGGDGYMLVGGSFTQITTFRYDSVTNVVVPVQAAAVPITVGAAMINLKTYQVIKLYSEAAGVAPPVDNVGNIRVQKVCICKTEKIVKAKGVAQTKDVEGYIALIGGIFNIDVTNDNNVTGPPPLNNRERIINVGCVLIRKDPNNPNNSNFEARLVAVDSKVGLGVGGGLIRTVIYNTTANFMLHSIVCQENEDKTETVFFIGGRFNRYNAIDYVAYEASKAAVVPGGVVARPGVINPNPTCNGIIKLTLKSEYDSDDAVSKHNQASMIEPIGVNAAGNADPILFASLQYGIINSKKYLFCLTGFLNAAPVNIYMRLNIFDLESKMIVIQTPDILAPTIVTNQTLLLTKDDDDKENIQNVLVMTITTNGAVPPSYSNYTFTCNVSSLNKDTTTPTAIAVAAAVSNGNVNIGKDNIITDMFYMEDTREVYISHENVLIANRTRTEYPLTVRSNYQALGEWKLESESKDARDDFDKFDNFVDKVIEMRKIFKLNPSMVLFLQDIDVRDYDGIDSKITKTRLEKMKDDLIRDALVDANAAAAAAPPVPITVSGFGWFTAAVGHVYPIYIDSPCNEVDKKIKNIIDFVYALKTPSVDLIAAVPPIAVGQLTTDAISRKMYDFVNDLLFMLVYTGCNKLAELICNDYVKLVTTPPVAVAYEVLDRTTWRTRFEAVLGVAVGEVKTLIDKIGKKAKMYKEKTRITPDTSYDFKICSDPDTHTGVAHLVYNYNQYSDTLITLKSQENLKNKIYEYGSSSFFSSSSNEQFHMVYITDNIGNTMEQIKFCSFYKLDRRTNAPLPRGLFGDIGNADSETIYISVNIQEEDGGKQINSGQVFEFLDIIRRYFMNLRSGAVIVDIGISGPIKRLILGGDFGCNLLKDVEVCRKFKSKQMKIYTREDNNSAFNDNEGTNHIFMINVDLESAVQVGGGNGDDNNNQNNHKNQKRICIGECINMNRVVTSKRKTRRKVPLLLSSS
jgi:hypothetical protein